MIPQRPQDGFWLPAVALASLLSAYLNEPKAAASLYSLLGMTAVGEELQALRAAHASETAAGEPVRAEATAEVCRNLFRREVEYWTVRYEGSVARL
jgi:hypothetical protein